MMQRRLILASLAVVGILGIGLIALGVVAILSDDPEPPTAPFTPARLTASNVTDTGATLSIADHSGAWRYKADAGPHVFCSSSVTSELANVSGLEPGASYTYTAYGDDGCAVAIAYVSFTTPTAIIAGVPTPTPTPTPRPRPTPTPTATPVPPPTPTPTPTAAPTPTPPPAPKPRLSAVNLVPYSAILILTNHADPWHYRANAGPHAECSPAVDGRRANLTGLLPNVNLSYSAYADADCGESSLLATAPSFGFHNQRAAVADISATTAVLTVVDHAGPWRYQADKGAHAQCSDPVPDDADAVILTGLAPGADYRYTAYFEDGCSSAHRIGDPVSFTTAAPVLDVSNVSANDATLSISGWSLEQDGAWRYKANTGPDFRCSTAQEQSVVLSRLAQGASFTYRAYADADCAEPIASVSFTTQSAAPTPTPTPAPASGSGGGGSPPTSSATLTASGATATTVQLTIANHTGAWSYKHTSPSVGACASVGSGTTGVTARGLTKSTTYTFTAYGGGNCATALATASPITTATPSLTASDVTHSSVVLTISGWAVGSGQDGSWYYKHAQDSTCSGAQSYSAAQILNLLPGRQYDYSAYSDSGCTNLLAAAPSFTTLAAPVLSVSNIGATTATLTFSNFTGARWHYQANTGPDTSCRPATTTSVSLTGLSAGVRYTYKAYVQTGFGITPCIPGNLVDSVDFLTRAK